jgi:bifunctional UDP-N-acetylglucosamine pyrophosphorylase/glucosamine-1-phosphate N-acetyltransferase
MASADKAVLILAAGLGKRMGSDLPKAAVATQEMPLIAHVLKTVSELSPKKVVVVTGHKKALVEEVSNKSAKENKIPEIIFSYQAEQKGTGDAVRCALPALAGFKGSVLILYGDVPLITVETLSHLYALHEQEKATITLLSFIADNPQGYGRIVRNQSTQHVERIIESKDCSPKENLIKEVNSGIYLVDAAFLTPAVNALENKNAQKEFYLTDIIAKACKEGQRVSVLTLHEHKEVQGVNTPFELSLINETLRERRIRSLVNSGVIIEDTHSLYIDSAVQIAPGARIGSNVQLRGATSLAKDVYVEGTAFLSDTTVAENAHIKLGVRAEGAKIGARAVVGPFAHLRPGTILEGDVKVGNFVETKKAHLKSRVAASHLSYLGDCTIGENSNIGAGTITCNYDGANKNQTTIEADVFVGSNTALVAPVVIGKGATIGAGSTITRDVPQGALALTRAELKIRSDYTRPKKK